MTYTKEELLEMVRKMRTVSNNFYGQAIQTGCHTFIEFCGLMNKYIDVCQKAAEAGVDFTESSIHSGRELPVENHDVEYLAEKFGCIFGATLHARPHLWSLFQKATLQG